MAEPKGGLIQTSLTGNAAISPEWMCARTIRNDGPFVDGWRPEIRGLLTDTGR